MKRLLLLLIGWFTLVSAALFAQTDCDAIAEIEMALLEGAKPFTSLDVNNKPCQFQFAIVTDRTGGHRPGIFMDGVRKLNLLQPEFVLSVGDLIEGYTEDLDELNRQWDEFNGFIDSLTMPFFYVPGNHDITNKVMEELWLQKYGKAYYHFVYKEVLFLCLNSEDQYRGAGRGTISTPQYEYIKTTLADNPDVRWTMVFLHQPLWNQENPERWPDVEALLADRKHTVFAGHVHHYAKYNRNNGKYFTLATTGGGTRARGPEIGEFDHVTWITMTEEGPILANLQLEGIWDENVSTESTRSYVNDLTNNNPIKIEPLFVSTDQFESGKIRFKVTNDRDIPMQINWKESFSWGLKSDFVEPKMEIAPNSVAFAELEVASRKKNTMVNELEPVKVMANVKYMADDLPDFGVPMTFYVAPEKQYDLNETKNTVVVDGQTKDWPEKLSFSVGEEGEGMAHFDLCYDANYLYMVATVYDDELVADEGSTVWTQDFIGFALDAKPTNESAVDVGRGWYRESIYALQTPRNLTRTVTEQTEEERLPVGSKMACQVAENSYTIELAVPMSYIIERQGENWKTVRFNFALQDKDAGQEGVRHFFKPEWRSRENRVGSGMFFR